MRITWNFLHGGVCWSVAPPERSNVGIPGKQRPVSQVPAANWNKGRLRLCLMLSRTGRPKMDHWPSNKSRNTVTSLTKQTLVRNNMFRAGCLEPGVLICRFLNRRWGILADVDPGPLPRVCVGENFERAEEKIVVVKLQIVVKCNSRGDCGFFGSKFLGWFLRVIETNSSEHQLLIVVNDMVRFLVACNYMMVRVSLKLSPINTHDSVVYVLSNAVCGYRGD